MPNTNPAAAPTPDNVSAAFRAMLTFLRLMLGWPQIVDPDVKSDIRALLRVVEAGETEHRRRAALAPAAAPDDYPPAVLKEADLAMWEAHDAARREKPRGRTAAEFDHDATRAGAQAYAAALARHTVAVRMAAAEQAATDRERPAACGLCDVGAHDPRIHVLWPADATVEQVRPEQAEIARLTAEREALKTKLHEADEEIDSERERVVMLEEERDALAKRVEALRGALEEIGACCPAAPAEEFIAQALAADDKAAQS